jgi:hypothetical protein
MVWVYSSARRIETPSYESLWDSFSKASLSLKLGQNFICRALPSRNEIRRYRGWANSQTSLMNIVEATLEPSSNFFQKTHTSSVRCLLHVRIVPASLLSWQTRFNSPHNAMHRRLFTTFIFTRIDEFVTPVSNAGSVILTYKGQWENTKNPRVIIPR